MLRPDSLRIYVLLLYNWNVEDFQSLAEFRYQIRRFLRFSEESARRHGIEPQQHQLLLTVKGYRGEAEGPTVGYLADRLQLRPNTAVELVNRMESSGLVIRRPSSEDRRRSIVHATARGERILSKLSAEHHRELRENGPALVAALQALLKKKQKAA